jgi:tRNA(fMet)-specific endonuclease VapC
MHMLDTNICIYVLKNHSAALRRKFRDCGDLCISVVTWAELCFGVENGTPALKESRWVQLDAFTRLLPVLAMDEPVGVCYGRVRAHLKKEGTPIGNNDLFIAAHALSLGATLVTNNQREFNRVPELVVENWV